jgi:hypothetical protein
MQVLIPTESFEDWRRLLAKPWLHWKTGYSAKTLARCWEAATRDGFPPEVKAALDRSGSGLLVNLTPLLAIPEYRVPLPGGDRPSQTDLLVLARGQTGLVAIAVEGKVNEAFGQTLDQRQLKLSDGSQERLAFLLQRLQLPESIPGAHRYQLFHRTVSALLVAEEFHAKAAVMLVHSFSPEDRGFSDFNAFADLFHVKAEAGKAFPVGTFTGTPLFLCWCAGDQSFREDEPNPAFNSAASVPS